MHNGGLGGWKYIKRRLGERLHDKWYLNVQGGTDSEWAFALFLDRLERLGFDPSSTPDKGFGPTVLRKAMLQTIEVINELTSSIPERIVQSENVDTRSLLNFAVSDGHSVICTRYVSSKTDEAASLYFSSGTQWEPRPSAGKDCDFQMDRRDKGAGIVLVASEPLTFERGAFCLLSFLLACSLAVGPFISFVKLTLPLSTLEKWVNVPTNSILTIHGQTVMVHPINDGFSERDPYHRRSSAFAQDKGLTTNEKAAARVANPLATTPGADLDGQRVFPGSVIPTGGAGRARTPDAPRNNRSNLSTQPVPPLPPLPPLPPHIANFVSGVRGYTSHGHATHNSISNSGIGSTISRPLSPPPSRPHTAGVKSPSQGNIKKKRRSLTAGEHAHPAEYLDADASQPPDSPVIVPSVRGSDIGTSEKAARVLGIGGFGSM